MKSAETQKLGLAFLVSILQFQAVRVTSERNSIRGEYKRPDRDRIGSSYDRGKRPPINDGGGNDLKNNNDSVDENAISNPNESLDLVLVPQCNPTNSDSFYSQSKRAENKDSTDYLEDTIEECDEYLQYCDKKRSNVAMSWPNYVFPNDFYSTVEVLYDQCFKSCVEYLAGGVEEFCSMPKPEKPLSAEYTSASSVSNEYCDSVEDSAWTVEMIAHETAVLEALNVKRGDAGGQICTRNTNNGAYQEFFPRRSPVTTNASLRCAARIQAKNIVKATIDAGGRFPGNLHRACPNADFGGGTPICEDFATRIINSGYSYHENGFGRINEVAAAGYKKAEAVIDGWLSSKSGHCSAIEKQESLVVPTEVGIGYYKDEETGKTGHVMLLGQRQL